MSQLGVLRMMLDKANANIMLADIEFNLVYVNKRPSTRWAGLDADIQHSSASAPWSCSAARSTACTRIPPASSAS